MESPLYRLRAWWNKGKKKKASSGQDTQDLNVQLAWYAFAIVVGVVGATYASVPLYKVFCQVCQEDYRFLHYFVCQLPFLVVVVAIHPPVIYQHLSH
jgi:hypothetical protein